jgi:hypothetical protein
MFLAGTGTGFDCCRKDPTFSAAEAKLRVWISRSLPDVGSWNKNPSVKKSVPLIATAFALPPALATAVAETFPVLDEAVALPFCFGTNEVVV